MLVSIYIYFKQCVNKHVVYRKLFNKSSTAQSHNNNIHVR